MINWNRNRRNRRFLGLAGLGSGAILAVPGPVGGVVAGCSTGAERGGGGELDDGEEGTAGVGFDGVVDGAELEMAVSPRDLSSAKNRRAARH